ncbi:hypothetical protein [Burkholderia stagnalis]|uniref:GAP1-N1 domain-containing protein n=1 Tax=Burkholderia stagnalis TaxID=1503054 RepID=UPI000AFC340C|nr:hypothetical protein [Burkholderia stagnalis]
MYGSVKQQLHGYRRGHELLASSISLEREDQDTVDRISDISGSLGPGESFDPYLTAYPLPSGSYYVLARTWQDLTAPRAGCVLTRSLLIPTREWMSAPALDAYLALLTPFGRDVKGVEEGPPPPPTRRIMFDVSGPRLFELVEALFLESRRPIVAFGFERSAELIAERVLAALWPDMRSKFSLSTFSIGPRQVAGRDIDLSFAPVAARQRFSGFGGRRIEIVERTPRHRWTQVLVERLFASSHPSLVDRQTLRFLGLDKRANELDLRVALLWSELWSQSSQSTSAVLGLLDILNSRDLLSVRVDELRPVILRAIDEIRVQDSVFDALQYIDTLLGKFTHTRMPVSIAVHSMRTVGTSAERQPSEALQYLQRNEAEVSHVVVAAVGDAIEQRITLDDPGNLLGATSARTLWQLCAASRRFAARIIELLDGDGPSTHVEKLFNYQGGVDNPYVLARARRYMLPILSKPQHAPVLRFLLKSADRETILGALSTIWRTTRLDVPEFDRPLLDASLDDDTCDSLRVAISQLPETSSSNRLLIQSLSFTESNVLWVCQSDSLTSRRAAHVMATLIDDVGEDQLSAVLSYGEITQTVLRILQTIVEEASTQIARVLLAGVVPLRDGLAMTLAILDRVADSQRTALAKLFVQRGLESADAAGEKQVEELIEENIVSATDIFEFAVAADGASRDVGDNLALLNRLGRTARNRVLMLIGELSYRLAGIPAWRIGVVGIDAWANLIQDAGNVNKQSQVAAAWAALAYTLQRQGEPVSRLIVASFPVVYDEVRIGNDPPYFFSSISFFDWDKCKTLRRELVRAFMNSQWPSIDLLFSAHFAGDLSAILRVIRRQWGGREYLLTADRAVEQCDEPLRSYFHKEISIAESFRII